MQLTEKRAHLFDFFEMFIIFFFKYYTDEKQTIASLDTSCYRGVPKKANNLFAAALALLSVKESGITGIKISFQATG